MAAFALRRLPFWLLILLSAVAVFGVSKQVLAGEGHPHDSAISQTQASEQSGAHARKATSFAWPDWEKVKRVISFRDHNTRVVFSGLTLLGIVSGITGTFLLLRKRSLLSDSVSHATLPGLAIAFIALELISGKGDSLNWLLIGGAITGFLAMLAVIYLPKISGIKSDASLALSLTFFYGIGVVLLSVIQMLPTANASGLEYLIYGNAATLTSTDVQLILAICIVCLVACILFFKEFSLLCFDSGYAKANGFPANKLDIFLMTLIVLISIVGLQAVGLLLIMALLITPAVSARFWAKRMGRVTFIAGLIGGTSAFIGVLMSSLFPRLPAGAIVVLTATLFFILSLTFGSYRGLLSRWFLKRRAMKRIEMNQFLRSTFDVLEGDQNDCMFIENERIGALMKTPIVADKVWNRRSWSRAKFAKVLGRAVSENWIRLIDDGTFILTEDGVARARHHARQHRLWELYLIKYADVAPSQVHHDVERIEEVAAPEVVREIEDIFQNEIKSRVIPVEPHPQITQ
ncbi:MAG: iron chelate uptake ABC transporter family permease subunit [Verrucomicrobiota bacterium]